MKVSKVVLIVVALHVLVIGGIFVFEGCSRTQQGPTGIASDESAPPTGTEANATLPTVSGPMLPTTTPLPPAGTDLVPATQTGAIGTAIPTTTPMPAASALQMYTVKKGDSLWKIALAEKVSIGDLARANNLTKTSVLQIGQKLQIPAASAETITATASVIPTTAGGAAAAPAIDTGATYAVKSGDSLWKIARQNNVSVSAIKQANSLTSDSLKIGQKLVIPAATASSASVSATTEWQPGPSMENGQMVHIVDIGESPEIIARKHGIKTSDLMRANNITDPKRIYVGQKLTIPGTVAPAATSPTVVAPTTAIPAGQPTVVAPASGAPVVSAATLRIN